MCSNGEGKSGRCSSFLKGEKSDIIGECGHVMIGREAESSVLIFEDGTKIFAAGLSC
jgi:hypothetical protein